MLSYETTTKLKTLLWNGVVHIKYSMWIKENTSFGFIEKIMVAIEIFFIFTVMYMKQNGINNDSQLEKVTKQNCRSFLYLRIN